MHSNNLPDTEKFFEVKDYGALPADLFVCSGFLFRRKPLLYFKFEKTVADHGILQNIT